jgi:DNA-binding transcriptional LysR family regulator
MMEFELLRSFAAVAECGGFPRAAERLNLTQSTVSQQIKRLELETKRPLFRRTTRAVALTDDGEMLLGDARRLLQLRKQPGIAWRRRGCQARCVSAWSRRSLAALCLRRSAASPSSIRA